MGDVINNVAVWASSLSVIVSTFTKSVSNIGRKADGKYDIILLLGMDFLLVESSLLNDIYDETRLRRLTDVPRSRK